MSARTRSLAAAATVSLALALGTGAAAQTTQNDQDHSAHHPEAAQAQAAPQTAPPPVVAPQGGRPAAPGMGMTPGMRGQGGMMGGDMAQMMQRMMAMHGGAGLSPGSMRAFDRIEGQLAYFRTELRLTDAQMPQWNAFADAVRAQADRLRQAYTQAMQSAEQPTSAPVQLERRAALLRAQLEATQAMAAAAAPLYAALTDEQKRTADVLMAEHLRDMRMRGL